MVKVSLPSVEKMNALSGLAESFGILLSSLGFVGWAFVAFLILVCYLFFQAQIIAAITIVVLGLFGWVFLTKGIDSFMVQDSPVIGIVLISIGILCLFGAVYMLNPSWFSRGISVQLGMVDPLKVGNASAFTSGAQWLEVTPISSSVLGTLPLWFQQFIEIVLIGGAVLVLYGFFIKKRR